MVGGEVFVGSRREFAVVVAGRGGAVARGGFRGGSIIIHGCLGRPGIVRASKGGHGGFKVSGTDRLEARHPDIRGWASGFSGESGDTHSDKRYEPRLYAETENLQRVTNPG